MTEEASVSGSTAAAVATKKKSTTKKTVVAITDQIIDTAAQLEKLTKAKAFALVPELIDRKTYTEYELGGVFSVIQSNGWYKEEGFESFKDFVEAKYGFSARKALYFIEIYNCLVESGVPWKKVKKGMT